MPLTYEQARALLERHGQAQVLRFWPRLSPREQTALLEQIAALDFDSLARMRERLAAARPAAADAAALEPAPVLELAGAEREQARQEGAAALRAGQVGALLVAGGQGSRLGFDGPKGVFPIGPVSGASLFEIHARKILALERKYAARVPFYIMTSRENDEPTRRFFAQHRHFGLDPERVRFFVQGMWPALDPQGRIILDAPGHIFLSPDGHGGILEALRVNGLLEDMTRRGLSTLFYFQVDNPLVEIADPVFLGAHRRQRAELSLKVCAKRDAEEGLGVVARRGGRPLVVEYTELTSEQKHARRPDGQLLFRYGSVAIHVFDLEFLKREAARPLPLHVAHKKVPYCDERGATVKPEAPNAYKFEKFIFDVLPDAERSLNLAFAREDEFSPVKNAAGPDSPETARRDQALKFARWFERCGIAVPRDAAGAPRYRLEIDPCFALGPEDLRARLPAGFAIAGDTRLAEPVTF